MNTEIQNVNTQTQVYTSNIGAKAPEHEMSIQQLLTLVISLCEQLSNVFIKNQMDSGFLSFKKFVDYYKTKLEAIHQERDAKLWQGWLQVAGAGAGMGLLGTWGVGKLAAEIATSAGQTTTTFVSGIGNIPETVISNESKENNILADALKEISNDFNANGQAQDTLTQKVLDRELAAAQAFVEAGQQLINALRV